MIRKKSNLFKAKLRLVGYQVQKKGLKKKGGPLAKETVKEEGNDQKMENKRRSCKPSTPAKKNRKQVVCGQTQVRTARISNEKKVGGKNAGDRAFFDHLSWKPVFRKKGGLTKAGASVEKSSHGTSPITAY